MGDVLAEGDRDGSGGVLRRQKYVHRNGGRLRGGQRRRGVLVHYWRSPRTPVLHLGLGTVAVRAVCCVVLCIIPHSPHPRRAICFPFQFLGFLTTGEIWSSVVKICMLRSRRGPPGGGALLSTWER